MSLFILLRFLLCMLKECPRECRSQCQNIYSRFFENQPNEICSHFSEKASKVTFLTPKKPQNHCNEGEGKETFSS